MLRAQFATAAAYPSRATTVRPVGPLARWLLGCAVLCLVAQSTLLPVAAPWASVWDPEHTHLTLQGSVPKHEHTYDDSSDGEAGCQVNPDAAGEPAGQDARGLVCAPSADGTTASPGAVLLAAPDAVAGMASLEVWLLPSPPAAWTSAVLDVLTPPPRTNT